MKRKSKGYESEQLATDYLVHQGYTCIERNYTIRGGEIDIIAEKEDTRHFVEVKCVDHTEELIDYISKQKQANLLKTISHYNHHYPTDKNISLDLIFVKNNSILHHYLNITNN